MNQKRPYHEFNPIPTDFAGKAVKLKRSDVNCLRSLVTELDLGPSAGKPHKALPIWPHCLFKCLAIASLKMQVSWKTLAMLMR